MSNESGVRATEQRRKARTGAELIRRQGSVLCGGCGYVFTQGGHLAGFGPCFCNSFEWRPGSV